MTFFIKQNKHFFFQFGETQIFDGIREKMCVRTSKRMVFGGLRFHIVFRWRSARSDSVLIFLLTSLDLF